MRRLPPTFLVADFSPSAKRAAAKRLQQSLGSTAPEGLPLKRYRIDLFFDSSLFKFSKFRPIRTKIEKKTFIGLFSV